MYHRSRPGSTSAGVCRACLDEILLAVVQVDSRTATCTISLMRSNWTVRQFRRLQRLVRHDHLRIRPAAQPRPHRVLTDQFPAAAAATSAMSSVVSTRMMSNKMVTRPWALPMPRMNAVSTLTPNAGRLRCRRLAMFEHLGHFVDDDAISMRPSSTTMMQVCWWLPPRACRTSCAGRSRDHLAGAG